MATQASSTSTGVGSSNALTIVDVLETIRNPTVWCNFNPVKLPDGTMKAHCKHCAEVGKEWDERLYAVNDIIYIHLASRLKDSIYPDVESLKSLEEECKPTPKKPITTVAKSDANIQIQCIFVKVQGVVMLLILSKRVVCSEAEKLAQDKLKAKELANLIGRLNLIGVAVAAIEHSRIPGCGKQSRSEKKSHKAMFKLGMKVVLGVSRVTIRRTENDGQISYEDSEVIMKPGTDWGKASLGRLTASNDEDFIHLMLTFSWFQDGQISYEEFETVMKPGTDWGKASLTSENASANGGVNKSPDIVQGQEKIRVQT
ncbi:zinc finger, BED-type, phospholipase-like, homeodomain-like protein [Tanacetum coccineum]